LNESGGAPLKAIVTDKNGDSNDDIGIFEDKSPLGKEGCPLLGSYEHVQAFNINSNE